MQASTSGLSPDTTSSMPTFTVTPSAFASEGRRRSKSTIATERFGESEQSAIARLPATVVLPSSCSALITATLRERRRSSSERTRSARWRALSAAGP